MTAEQVFLKFSRDKLAQLASRIAICLDKLTPEQIWKRQGENENAVGNLVLHLCGNVRQWIGFGVAGQADIRERDREFAARGGPRPDELKARLESKVQEALKVLERLAPERLLERTRIQGYEVTILEAVYHVVEHFSQHTGQILYATKRLTAQDLGFYKHLNRQSDHEEKTP